jgi:hypothetical protein
LTLQAGAVVSPALGDKSSTMETISSAGNVTAQ